MIMKKITEAKNVDKKIEIPLVEENDAVCPCCEGTGVCEDINNEQGACLTCGGRG